MPTADELRILQALDLETKIKKTNLRIREWYEFYEGNVYVSFSGGKDSTVLLHLVRNLYPEVPAVFSDTGLEFPEIRDFVKTIESAIWLRPQTTFNKVIENYGYPVISKEIALTIEYARKKSSWAIKRLNGEQEWGNHKKYKFLLDAPFKISNQCCYKMKKEPMHLFEKETGLKPFIGTMASEGGQRESAYKKTGCNAFSVGKSMPIGFWKEQDIWDYIHKFNVSYSKIYDMGYQRTGCMFCMFGCHLEKSPNRFQRMQKTHPKQYDYCMNKLGLKQVLDYINVPYSNDIDVKKKLNGVEYQQYKIDI